MPSKKKKYNARFPAGRIKKIMQSDEEVGKVAQAVPIIISKTLELFVESLLEKSLRITYSRNAKTLSPSHMKQCIMAESRFDFLRELVKNIPDISVAEETAHDNSPGPPPTLSPNDTPYDLSMPSTSGGHHTSIQASPSSACTTITSTNTNGNTNALRNGLPPPINSPIPPVQRSTSVPSVSRGDRKRSFEQQASESPARYSANFYKESSIIQHTSDVEAFASKMRRTDSEPAPYTIHLSATHDPIRRLQHQSKSIPCTSKEINQSHMPRQSQLSASLLQSSPHQLYQSHSHVAQPPILTPAPIINVDICNKPIVKIDYSNLALPDKETTDCTRKENKSLNSLASTCISPVINIDLSNFQNVVKDDVAKAKTSLELDEDYDNI